MLAEKLRAPISWTAEDPEIDAFLDRLQGNILKFHGRWHIVHLFCRFRADRKADALAFLRGQVARVRSASEQLAATRTKRATGVKDAAPFVSVFLTAAGYDYFGVPQDRWPPDEAFRAGMGAADLNDPPQAGWDSHIRDPHLMVLVAMESFDAAQHESTRLLNLISDIGDVADGNSGELIGTQYFNDAGHGIENFGYVDGRSQPLVLTEDLAGEAMTKWPLRPFPVDQFVVPDPGAGDASAYGSYFVFRQLEQDVEGFKTAEARIEKLTFKNGDSAAVGRLESGTPFELTSDDHDIPDITNDFLFESEPPRCPHFAHIRKVNPRTEDTQANLMIRRATTYGQRPFHPAAGDPAKRILKEEKEGHRPRHGVGLLFQSYQASVADQFEISQRWANSAEGGIDPVIGQQPSALIDWPRKYGQSDTVPVDFYDPPKGRGSYVVLRGGGYFFAPSLPFLRGL